MAAIVGAERGGGMVDRGRHRAVAVVERVGRVVSLAVGLALLLSVSAEAQVHPCDEPEQTGALLGNDAKAPRLQFCVPADNAIDAVTVYTNSTPTHLTALTRVTPATNGGGLALYEVTLGGPFAAGKYVIEVSAWNKSIEGVAREGPKSVPFALSVAVQTPAPSAPLLKRIVR